MPRRPDDDLPLSLFVPRAGRNRSARGTTAPRSEQGLPLLLFVLFGMFACCAVGCTSGPPKPAGPWASFPASPALDAVKGMHAEAATDRDQRLLLTTWFADGDPNVAQVCSVLPDGHVNTYRFVYDSSLQDSRKRDLSGEQLAALRQDLDALPASQPTASVRVEDLLIVSFRHAGQWVTRFYDRTRRAGPVSDLFEVTGAPIDPPP